MTGHWHAKYQYTVSETQSAMYRIEEDVDIFGSVVPGDWLIKYYPDSSNHNLYEVILEYDVSLNAVSYKGNVIYYDEADLMWVWQGANGAVGMLFEIQKTATYIAPDGTIYVITSDESGGWIYEVNDTVTGYVYKDSVTGDYMVHYLPTSITAVTVDQDSFYVEGAQIVYDSIDARWEYAVNESAVPELAGALHVASYKNRLIYAKLVSVDCPFTPEVDPQDEIVWYYLDSGEVAGVMYEFHDVDGSEIYTIVEGIDTRAIYWKDGTVYMWSGTEWLQYGPFDYQGQSVYLGGSFKSMLPNIQYLDAWSDKGTDNQWGTVKTAVTGHASLALDGTPFVETASFTTYRNDPDYSIGFSSTHPDLSAAWGSALFGLDGALVVDGNVLTHENIASYVNTLTDTLMAMIQTADGVLSTRIAQFLQTSAGWTGDQWMNFAHGSGRFLIVTENTAYNMDDLNWAADGVDMSGIYQTGNAYDELLVIPTFLNTRYIGIFDLMKATGWGISTTAEAMLNNFLVETWQETIGSTVNYYANISLNYVKWWYTAMPGEEIHAKLPTNLRLNLVYLDKSVDPGTALKDSIRAIPDVIVAASAADPSIPIEIGVIILPLKAEVGDPVNVTVGIIGETIGAIKFRVDSVPTEFNWDVQYDFFIINVPYPHWGQRVSTIVAYPTVATHKITVVVYDTKSAVAPAATKTATIDIKTRASDIYAWVAAIIATLFGMFGIALVKNKKVSRGKAADCIGDACNI